MSTQRRILNKQGFTLIELMVVIVIIGILAAIAIPKLFGMTAKAKASEVGPAAGTWSKLQQAFMMESDGGKPGKNFAAIGYTPPGYDANSTDNNNVESPSTNNFSYSSSNTTPSADPDLTAVKAKWTATAKAGIREECTGKQWEAEYEAGQGKPTASGNYSSETLCINLTPQFKDLR